MFLHVARQIPWRCLHGDHVVASCFCVRSSNKQHNFILTPKCSCLMLGGVLRFVSIVPCSTEKATGVLVQ